MCFVNFVYEADVDSPTGTKKIHYKNFDVIVFFKFYCKNSLFSY